MKYEIIDVISSYKDKKLTSIQAMDAIISLFTPSEVSKDYVEYSRTLIAFLFNLESDSLINSSQDRYGNNTVFKAKCMYTKVLRDESILKKRLSLKEAIALLGVKGYSIMYYREEQHNVFYETDREYKHIFDIVRRTL